MIIHQRSAIFDGVQRLSKLLFGNQDRLVVAAAVADAETRSVYARQLAESIGIADARVGPQLAVFEEAGLLVRLPKAGGERRVYFERRESSFWTLCLDLCQEIIDAPEG
jgi:DNA-binding MarR family transcriptional regulator